MEPGGSPALLDGNVNHGNWWYAVGSRANFRGGIPGPLTEGASAVVQEVVLEVGTANAAATATEGPLASCRR